MLSLSFTGACFGVHRRNLIGHQHAFNLLHRGVGHGAAENLYDLNLRKVGAQVRLNLTDVFNNNLFLSKFSS
jgi:hypothetical protein